MSARTMTRSGAPPRTFEKLNKLFILRIIATEADLHDALGIAHRLAMLERRTSDQEVYLESLSMLIERYEAASHRIDTSALDPLEMLRYLVAQHGITPSGTGAAVLRGERPLSKASLLKFAAFFGVGPGVFTAE